MKSILITGGSRGLGLEFTSQYLKKGNRVYSTSRNPEESEKISQLKQEYKDLLSIHSLDVSDEKSRLDFYDEMGVKAEKIDILINNAGIASGNEKFRFIFGELNQEDLCKTLLVNTIAPLMMTEKCLSFLEMSENPIVVNISSDSGCITNKNRSGSYGYSSSKTALNMISKILSIELKDKGIIVVSLHPGWVKTTMAYTENAPLEVFESIHGMIQVIETLELKDTGKFLDWQGNEIPW
ncbi:MAG: SDR family oxidoreductase [Candidatus Kariarchaeaceae archaeon]|jgi:NAD(P)-dependent dehydrogenase (short-subunit alcohol dehydrogenase family)